MKKIKSNQIDIIILLINVVFAFIYNKTNISSLPIVICTLTSSFYFFPLKLIFNNKKENLLSDILISSSIAISIIGIYKDFKTLFSIIGLINFLFVIYFSFFILNKTKIENKSRLIIASHFLVMFLLITLG